MILKQASSCLVSYLIVPSRAICCWILPQSRLALVSNCLSRLYSIFTCLSWNTVGEQGQEGPAEAVLDKYTKEGGWVFLDNVHLMQGWIPALERKLEIAAETAHPDFRCFFSAEPINGAPQVRKFD